MSLPRGTSSGRGNKHLSSAIGRPERPESAPRTPLSRSSELKRGSGPKPSRGNLEALAQSGGPEIIDPGSISDSTLKRKPPSLKRGPRRKRPGGKDAGQDWREACLARNAYEHDGYPVDESTGEPLRPDWTCHHVLEVSHLNAAGFGSSAFIIWNVDNGMCLNADTHMAHHNHAPRITADKLREHHWDFARMLDDTQGTEAFSARLARDYPEVGS